MTTIIEVPKWSESRSYYKGFSKDRDVYLFYKSNGKKLCEIIKNYSFYFLIKKKDYSRSMINHLLSQRRILRVCDHKYNGIEEWLRIYCTKNFKRSLEFTVRQEPGEWNALANLVDTVEFFHKHKVQTYEADLTPLHRFLTDYSINFEDKIDRFYFDLETDDTIPGFEERKLMKSRILSFSWYDDNGNTDYHVAEQNTDSCERKLLFKFYELASLRDCIVAWNGANFDFKMLRWRMQYHGIKEWNRLEHMIIHADLLQSARRHTPSGEFKSFSLRDVGERVLGLKKLSLHGKRIHELFNSDRKLLEEYNRRDAELLYKIEKEKAYNYMDIVTAKLANRFSNYYMVSTKVDGALLREANIRGWHYPTVTRTEEKQAYEGGYVLTPKIGLHKKVAALDFKSLYPSLINTYNISHDTIVDKENYGLVKSLIRTPVSTKVGCKFVHDRVGVIPSVLQDLYKKRKYFESLRDKEAYNSQKFNYFKWIAIAHKTLMLSFYGELGNFRGRYFNLKMARTITLCGQFYNKFVRVMAKRKKKVPLYGDTDSVFIAISLDEVKEFLEYVHRGFRALEKNMGSFDNFMELEFDNYFDKIFFTGKKRYAGSMTLFKGKPVKDYIYARGLEVRRNDIPILAKKFQNFIMQQILIKNASEVKIKKFIKGMRAAVRGKNLPAKSLVIYQSVSKSFSDYTKPIIDSKTGQEKITKDGNKFRRSLPIHVKIAKRLVKKGMEFYVGSQIPYIVTSTKPLDGVHEDEFTGEYDVMYYWNDKIFEPVKRILKVVFPNTNWEKYYIEKN